MNRACLPERQGLQEKSNRGEKTGLQILSAPASEFCLSTLTFAVLSSRLGLTGCGDPFYQAKLKPGPFSRSVFQNMKKRNN
jgi:hypothetical protein